MSSPSFLRLPTKEAPNGVPLPFLAALALCQATMYALTGLWAIVDLRSFQRVTGPKTDRWLVKTVGALVVAIAAALGLAGARRQVTVETVTLAAGSAIALGAIDVVYVARRRISPIYLVDAVAEAAFALCWLIGWRARPTSGQGGRR